MENTNQLQNINRKKIFRGICLALFPTGFSFVLVSNILFQLKSEFILTNAQVGYIGGAALWGMAASLLIIGPFLEKFGLKKATIGAFVCHLSGVTFFLFGAFFAGDPNAFWILFLGAIGFGAGNGFIEVAGNPLTAALFPDNKTTKLNHFHAFFPGSMVIGGLLGWLMTQAGYIGSINIAHWTWQIGIIYIPVIVYGFLLLPEKFPKTETAEAGISMSELFKYTFTHPLVLGLIFLKMITLSLEMGPSRWIPEVLKSAGVHGMLVFVWISGLMAVLRLSAGKFVETLSPTGMLLGSSVLTGIGLLMFAFIETGLFALMIAATIFACGVAFYFPTMVGLMSERFPKAGSLGLLLMIGMGFFAAGGANAIMGGISDQYLPDALDEQQTIAILQQVEEQYPEYIQRAEEASGNTDRLAELGYREVDVRNVLFHTEEALAYYRDNGELSGNLTGNALRAISDSSIPGEEELVQQALGILRPADNYGGRMSFLWVGPIAFLVALVFLILYINDKKKGGYQVVKLEKRDLTA
ncbi:MFS transporter [Rhodohalobacter sp. 614A]|uniref:MFS transporter n=1 Tax=Rhodohalobacter sp. 614A TaxID=2908649 RepID=UPI001F43C4F8|nr:MFS transporter [Rhodohalobacter sp. 614A]